MKCKHCGNETGSDQSYCSACLHYLMPDVYPDPKKQKQKPKEQPTERTGFKLAIQSIDEIEPTDPIGLLPRRFIRKGVTIVASPPKAGKTWVMIDTALRLAKRKKALGNLESQRKQRVLYMMADKAGGFVRSRYERLGGTTPDDNFQVMTQKKIIKENNDYFSLSNPERLEQLEKHIAEFKIDLVVVDTVISWCDANENKNEEVRKLLMGLKMIAENQDCNITLLHHLRKQQSQADDNETPGADEVIGASAWIRLCDEFYMLVPRINKETKESMNEGTIYVQRGWYEGIPAITYEIKNNEKIYRKHKDGTIDHYIDMIYGGKEPFPDDIDARIKNVLREEGIPGLQTKDIVERLKDFHGESTIKKHIQKLYRAGQIDKSVETPFGRNADVKYFLKKKSDKESWDEINRMLDSNS